MPAKPTFTGRYDFSDDISFSLGNGSNQRVEIDGQQYDLLDLVQRDAAWAARQAKASEAVAAWDQEQQRLGTGPKNKKKTTFAANHTTSPFAHVQFGATSFDEWLKGLDARLVNMRNLRRMNLGLGQQAQINRDVEKGVPLEEAIAAANRRVEEEMAKK
ncbi:MAG: hypothetical protein QE263_03390 [Vampirovibrionales bacterium]|nr:hypothetical protein [Vampirovibrionales bacterium]